MTNVAIVLAGGVGSRIGADIPKQYIEVNGKPIIFYSLETFQQHSDIHSIVIVANEEWISSIEKWNNQFGITKVAAVIPGGMSRQHSVLNGLRYLDEHGVSDDTRILIHDSARPGVTSAVVDRILSSAENADGVLPVVPVKDAIYSSKAGKNIDGILDRNELFAGQSPEVLNFRQYYQITNSLSDEQLLQIRGCCELAVLNGFQIRLVLGDEKNYKITTQEDLDRFCKIHSI